MLLHFQLQINCINCLILKKVPDQQRGGKKGKNASVSFFRLFFNSPLPLPLPPPLLLALPATNGGAFVTVSRRIKSRQPLGSSSFIRVKLPWLRRRYAALMDGRRSKLGRKWENKEEKKKKKKKKLAADQRQDATR